MAAVKYRNKMVDLDTFSSIEQLEEHLQNTRKIIATIEETLEYPLIVDAGAKRQDVSGATYALKLYKVGIPLIEQAIAERRKQERIAQQTSAAHGAAGKKAERQKALAEHFVQVAWERMNEPLFDAFMAEAKRRRTK